MICQKLCVAALIDRASEDSIIAIQRALGRSACAAHITLGVYEAVETDEIIAWVDGLVASASSFPLAYTGIGVMDNPFIYAIPRPTSELLLLYERLQERFDEYCINFTSAAAGDWTPHTSLSGYSPQKVDIAVKMFSKINGSIIGLKVVDCTDDSFELLYSGRFDS